MKNRQSILKGTKASEREESSTASEDVSRKSVTPQPRMSTSRERSGSARRVVSKSSTCSTTKELPSAEASPQLYKAVHNIGKRKAAEHVFSYKETEIAVCFKDSYWPNAKLDLSNAMRTETSEGKSDVGKMKSSAAEGKKENEEKSRHEKSSQVKAETRFDLSVASCETSAPALLPSSNAKSRLEAQRVTQQKTSPTRRQSSRLSDESTNKSVDKEAEVPLMTSSLSRSKDEDDDEADVLAKKQKRLSSKKRAELSFLGLGLSSGVGASDVLTQRSKDEQQGVRARRTASLNAGAIVSLMLQKEDSVAKKTRLCCDDDDDTDDDDDDGLSSSSSSESDESTFSEYSAPGESKQMKRSTRSNASATIMTSNVEKDVSAKESAKEKPSVFAKTITATDSAVMQKKMLTSREVTKPSEESSESENTRSPFKNTDIQTIDSSRDCSGLETGQETGKGNKKFTFASALKIPQTNIQTSENKGGGGGGEARGKRKRKDLQDNTPAAAIPGKRMASLNAQAILAASRDERTKRCKGIEPPTKSRASSAETGQSATDPGVQGKTSRKSGTGECNKTSNVSAKASVSSDSQHARKGSGALSAAGNNCAVDSVLSASNVQCRPPLERVPFAGTYVELVSPPSSIQLVEMTSAPALTPNKTYQQLDRPQNCQQYSSDRQLAPVWPGNPYPIAQFSELHSNSGHPIDFHKNSSDRLAEKQASNVVTALIPHTTSLAPAVPIRFTAHIVPQNHLPQHGFYSQLQPHPSYYSERFSYGRPSLFSYPTKTFNASGCFASPHIPTDLYNASRQLQVYEVQAAARPVYGRPSDFNLQLYQPQFIGPPASHSDSRDQLQQLYRPYLNPPPQTFQHSQSQMMCAAPPYGPSSQVQVALAVSEVGPLAPPDKSPMAVTDGCQGGGGGGGVASEEKLLKTSPSDGQPKLTDISYSVVKRNSLSSRRKQVETKHSSTQVKSHEVISASGVYSVDCGLGSKETSMSAESTKPIGGRFLNDSRRMEKIEKQIICESNKTNFSAYPLKPAPPAHCQSYASGSKSSHVAGAEELRCSDLRSYSAAVKHKLCAASETEETEGGNSAKQEKEDFKSTVSDKVLLVSDTKTAVSDDAAEEPAADMKPVRAAEQPVIPHLKTELGNDGLHHEALPLQNPTAKKLECFPSSWSSSSDGPSIGRGQRTPEPAQSSIIDLSLDKELDLSRKTKVVELSEALVDSIPLKKKKLTPVASTGTKNTSYLCLDSLDLMPSSRVSLGNSLRDSTQNASKSCLSQLQNFVATHSTETPKRIVSENITEQKNEVDLKVTEEVGGSQRGSASDSCTSSSSSYSSSKGEECISLVSGRGESSSADVVFIRDEEDIVIIEPDSSLHVTTGSSDADGSFVKESDAELTSDCIIVEVDAPSESNNELSEEISLSSVMNVDKFEVGAKSERSQMETASAVAVSAVSLMDLTKSTKPFEVTTDKCSLGTKKVDPLDSAKLKIQNRKSEKAKNLSSKKSREKYGRSFRGSAPVGRIEGSAKFSRRLNLVGFANRTSSDRCRNKAVDAISRGQLNSASGAARQNEANRASVSKLGVRKGKKVMTLSFGSKVKRQMHLQSTSDPRSGSEKDGMTGDATEETYNGKDDLVKCWKWKEPGMMKCICTEVDGQAVHQMCYPAIEHTNGDVIRVRDCVFVRSGMRKKDVPYIAKIYAFWPLQETGEMMMGVFWYYRHHQNEGETLSKYLNNEVFASRHRDVIPVACIEDRCYVLTLNEFCRYKAEQKRVECNSVERQSVVPVATEPYGRRSCQPPPDADPDTVFLCRNIYDIKLRRISKHPRKLQP